MVTHPAEHYITITPVSPAGAAVKALVDEEPPRPTRRASWAIRDRARRKGMTEFTGLNPATMPVAIFLNRWDDDGEVEPEILALEKMLDIVPPNDEPPVLTVVGATIPPAFRHLQWVLEGINYGDELRRHNGNRTRAHMVLDFLEYVPPRLLAGGSGSLGVTSPAKNSATKAKAPVVVPAGTARKAKASSKTYVVKKGDTLPKIAQKALGNKNRWHEIATLNGINDPKRVTVGDRLRLPA